MTEEKLNPITFDPTKQYEVDFKLVLLGFTGVGKTAIIRNFIEGKSFDENNAPIGTIGGCFSSVIVNYKGCDVLMKCWDTGGQERHLALTASYYRGAAVAVVVFSWVDKASWDRDVASVKYWIEELRRNNPTCRIVLVGNKYDCIGPDKDVVDEDQVNAFCESQGLPPCIKTSANTGVGIHTVFRTAISLFFEAKGLDKEAEPAAKPHAKEDDNVVDLDKKTKPEPNKCC